MILIPLVLSLVCLLNFSCGCVMYEEILILLGFNLVWLVNFKCGCVMCENDFDSVGFEFDVIAKSYINLAVLRTKI